jgi:hypothetical protein
MNIAAPVHVYNIALGSTAISPPLLSNPAPASLSQTNDAPQPAPTAAGEMMATRPAPGRDPRQCRLPPQRAIARPLS